MEKSNFYQEINELGGSCNIQAGALSCGPMNDVFLLLVYRKATSAAARTTNRKRRSLWRFESIHTLRYQCLHRAGLLIRPQGRWTLDVGIASAVKERFMSIPEPAPSRLINVTSRLGSSVITDHLRQFFKGVNRSTRSFLFQFHFRVGDKLYQISFVRFRIHEGVCLTGFASR